MQAFRVEIELGRAGDDHAAVAAIGGRKLFKREGEPGLRVSELGVAAHHDAAAGTFKHAFLHLHPVVREQQPERAVGDRHALFGHGETHGVGGDPAVDARRRQAAAAGQLRIDAGIGTDADRNERPQQAQVGYVEPGIPHQRRAARQGERGAFAHQRAAAVEPQLAGFARVGDEADAGLAGSRVEIERQGGQAQRQRRFGQPHVARLAAQPQLAVESVGRAQIPVPIHPKIGRDGWRGLQQRQERCQRQIGEGATAGEACSLALELFDVQPATRHGQRQAVHLLLSARQQQRGGGHQFHWPVALHLGLIQLPAPHQIRIQPARQIRRRPPRRQAGVERQRVRIAATPQGHTHGIQALPGQPQPARIELAVERAVGRRLQIHSQCQGVGGDIARQAQAAGGDLRFDLQLGGDAAGAAATGQPPAQSQVQARQRRRVDVPDEPVARPAVRALQLRPVTGQIQIDVGIGEMAVFVAQPPMPAHRAACEFARRQDELRLQAQRRRQCTAHLATRIESRLGKFAEARRIDLTGLERGGEGARGVELQRALGIQPSRLSGEIRRLQTQGRIGMRQREPALPPSFADVGGERLARRVAVQLQRRLQARGIQLTMQSGQVEMRAAQVHAQAPVAPRARSAELPGRPQIDRQPTEIGTYAVAHHRAAQADERQAVLVEPPGLPVAETEVAQQAFARLAFEHAGKRQIGARRARHELARVDALPGHQQFGQTHACERRGFAAGQETHGFGLGIEPEHDRLQPSPHSERAVDRPGVLAHGIEAALQPEWRILAEVELATHLRPGRGSRHVAKPVAVAIVVDASVQVLEIERPTGIDHLEMRHVQHRYPNVHRQAQAGGQRRRRRVLFQDIDAHGLRRQQADLEPSAQQRARLPFQPRALHRDAPGVGGEDEPPDTDRDADMPSHAFEHQPPAAQACCRVAQPAKPGGRRRQPDHRRDQQRQHGQQRGRSPGDAPQNDTPSEKCRRNWRVASPYATSRFTGPTGER